MDRYIYEGLRSTNGMDREQALKKVVSLDPMIAADYFDHLVHMWKNEDGRLRADVADALCASSIMADMGRSMLIKIVKIEEDEGIAQRFVEFLTDAPPPPVADTQAIIDEIDDDDPISVFALVALRQLGEAADRAIPRLIELLSNTTDNDLQLLACSVLLQLPAQPGAIDCLDPLLSAAVDDDDLRYVLQALQTHWS